MNLKILRVMANLTQAEAAKAAGVNQATISDWERGEYKPGPSAVSRLAAAYHVSDADILKAVEDASTAREEL